MPEEPDGNAMNEVADGTMQTWPLEAVVDDMIGDDAERRAHRFDPERLTRDERRRMGGPAALPAPQVDIAEADVDGDARPAAGQRIALADGWVDRQPGVADLDLRVLAGLEAIAMDDRPAFFAKRSFVAQATE